MSSKALETSTGFMSHFTALDTDVLKSVLAEPYTHQYAPGSLARPGFDKEGLMKYVAGLQSIVIGYPMTIRQSLHSETSNAVTVWATGQVAFRDEVKDGDMKEWEHAGEYMFLKYLDETQEKVVKTVEFLDSKATTEKLLPLVKRAFDNLARVRTEGASVE